VAGELARFNENWKAAEAAVARIIAQEKPLAAYGAMLAAINEITPRVATQAEELLAQRAQQNAPAREIGHLAQLSVAVWRLSRDVNTLPSGRAGSDAGDLLARDLAQLRDATQLLVANADGEMRNRLQPLARASAELQSAGTAGLAAATAVAEAAAARTALQKSAEPSRQALASMQSLASESYGGRALYLLAGILFLLLAVATVLAIMQVLLRGSRRRMQEAEVRRLEAGSERVVEPAVDGDPHGVVGRLRSESGDQVGVERRCPGDDDDVFVHDSSAGITRIRFSGR